MGDQLPFAEGRYRVEKAFLVARNLAVQVDQVIVSIKEMENGEKSILGRGMVEPVKLVRLFDESEDVEMLIDFGGGYHYLLKQPEISAGKMFMPNVSTMMSFRPQVPLMRIETGKFTAMTKELELLGEE